MKEALRQVERPEEEYTMEKFLEEMRELKRQQEKEHISQDLAETETDVLTEEDMRMWRTIGEWQENPLPSEEMRAQLELYTQGFIGEDENLKEGIPKSRYAFCQFARNKAGEVIVRKQMEELKSEGKI